MLHAWYYLNISWSCPQLELSKHSSRSLTGLEKTHPPSATHEPNHFGWSCVHPNHGTFFLFVQSAPSPHLGTSSMLSGKADDLFRGWTCLVWFRISTQIAVVAGYVFNEPEWLKICWRWWKINNDIIMFWGQTHLIKSVWWTIILKINPSMFQVERGAASLCMLQSKASCDSLLNPQSVRQAFSKGLNGMVHPQSHGGDAKRFLILSGSAPLVAYDDESPFDCKPCSDARELSRNETSDVVGLGLLEELLLEDLKRT